MNVTELGKQIESTQFRRVKQGAWEGYRAPWMSLGDRSLIDWVESQASKLTNSPLGRGGRHRTASSPDQKFPWFIKQYHHGGLLSETGDVLYESPRIFLEELLAFVRAGRTEIDVPSPIGVFWKRAGEKCKGFFVSKALDVRPLSHYLRAPGRDGILERCGQILAHLHEQGIDHQDYHLDNLLINSEGTLYVIDFHPVGFGGINRWKRAARLHRFVRFLRKYGFHGDGKQTFLNGYMKRSSTSVRLSYQVESPLFYAKNRASDMIYALGGRPLRPIDTEKFLVRAPNWLGDAVMSLPMLQTLEERFPDSTVDVVSRSSVGELYEYCPSVRRVWTIPGDKSWRLPEEICEQRFSTILVIPKSFRTGLQAWRSRIPRRVGFNTQGRSWFLTDPVPLNQRDRSMHHARLTLKLTQPLAEPPEHIPDPRLDLSGVERSPQLEEWLNRKPYVTIHPGSAYGPAKRWPVERFQGLLEKLLEQTNWNIVVLGVASEEKLSRALIDDLPGSRCLDLTGQTSLTQAMYMLKHSQGTVANDSGLMHLSGALGTPTVGIFGSTDPGLTSPLGPRTTVVYEGVDCSPCFERTCPLSEDRYRCLHRIHPQDVLQTLFTLDRKKVRE